MPFGGLLTLGVTTGLNIWGAKKGAKASKEAAKTQQDSARRAQQFLRTQHEAAQQRAQPWMDMGGRGMVRLDEMMRLGPGSIPRGRNDMPGLPPQAPPPGPGGPPPPPREAQPRPQMMPLQQFGRMGVRQAPVEILDYR